MTLLTIVQLCGGMRFQQYSALRFQGSANDVWVVAGHGCPSLKDRKWKGFGWYCMHAVYISRTERNVTQPAAQIALLVHI